MINQSYAKSKEMVMTMAIVISTKDGMRYEFVVHGWIIYLSP